ncbi:SLIT-ROBO Rho GTPase-activating protein 3-like [Betta splendens]|uniref:SLIT-ROBO Rho GTPase-activating protein 3-like n=1 Tax=Betta splendens TaxID=158456 RepID=A0A9W2XY18_BETSP|nr:SLIT-ROBO Rho GTPase-activating protein 3-like [Betta splendens]
MSSHAKLRKERVGAVDYDAQIKEVRSQLVDQLKVLDLQLEQKSQQLQDLSDYLRRRGEIESEYARSLEKLAERFTSRTKRKEPSSNSVAQVWMTLLTQTRQESRDHNGLSESCSSFLLQPLTLCLDYTQRLAKKSKDICIQLQDGLLKVTTELQTAWRTYYQYHADYLGAEGKLREAEKQEEKQKQSAAKKLERLIEKRQCKVQDLHLKCSKARNEYLLNLDAANASVNKYYLKDISSLIDCADVGYHVSLERVMQAYLSGRRRSQQNLGTGLQQLQDAVSGLDQGQDRDTLLQHHYNTFSMPLRFPYQPHEGDQVSEVSAECEIRCELETRFKHIQTRLKAVTQETEGAAKGMLEAQSSLLENISAGDLELGSDAFLEGNAEVLSVKPSVARRRANLQEVENLYFTKVKEYLVGSSLISKLQAKHDLLKVAAEKAEASNERQPRHNGRSMRVRKNHSTTNLIHNHKLFNGDMLSFIQASGQQIPLVVESCVRFINLNGLHHEGIFRVPGSQVEINSLRDAFERGEDPLAEGTYDLDSVAGVLKLYFRGLENPLFPSESTGQLLEHAQIKSEAERAAQLKAVICTYPQPVIIVMRYLFAFLYHVSQYSDENMMQPYNLAVCFGPSLIRWDLDGEAEVLDQRLELQPLINALVKNIIIQHESVFPSQNEVEGPIYEICMTLEQDDCETVIEEGDLDTEYTLSKDDLEAGTSVDNDNCLFGATTQKTAERPRANSSGSIEQRRITSMGSGGRMMLQIPVGPNSRPRRVPSPGYKFQEKSSEDLAVQVDKDVCRQMNSVFKELLTLQTQQGPPPNPSSQSKGKRDGRRGRAGGLFRTTDPLE